MKIKLDDVHTLNSDNYCFWISRYVEPDKGKPYERRVSGYCGTFEQVVHSFIEQRLRSSEAEKVSNLAKEIKELKKMVSDWKIKVKRSGIVEI